MTPAGNRILAVLRRRKRLLKMVLVVLVLAFVPLFPYSPRCYDPYEPTTVGSIHLAPRYQQALTANLESYEVPYISVGPFVLLRFWTWLTDPDSWVANASNKAVRRFVDVDYGASLDDVPQRLHGLIAESRKPFGSVNAVCPLVRAVAIEGF